ncbi:chaperonin 10-like protein [Penicillium lagena]|uniref:chaperonin 10-like protein n=1 Tax=Penicillium lagena TaxID=94218 RepID=UPI002541B025|nr:chaperonin 10-like protein [Penicillium lagena]KAJ5620144.1 chaperonin 10-like protein [Penicillium lagena]
MENKAVWLNNPGEDPVIDTAPFPEPGENQLLVKTKAVAVQPGEWKLQAGIIPIPLKYPAIIGLSLSGVVVKVGPGVTRFQPGDRIASNSAGVMFNDYRFGAYQKYSLVPQKLTSKIGNTPFEDAAALSVAYGPISALFLHLGLERKLQTPKTAGDKVLVWGISSSFGALSAQIAKLAGYNVVGIAHGRHTELARALGINSFIDRSSPSAVEEATALGPFHAVLAAADSAEDQVKIGAILSAQGGGSFLSTMGVRPGVQLPEGVTGFFRQFIDDYLNPKNHEFTEWVWWNFLEHAFANNSLKSIPLEIQGGLSSVPEAWDLLRRGAVSGKRLIILPQLE